MECCQSSNPIDENCVPLKVEIIVVNELKETYDLGDKAEGKIF